VTDRLSLTNALADANIDRPAAERIATEIFDAIHDGVATKSDLERLEAAIRADLQREIAGLRADLQREVDGARTDLQRDVDGARTDLQRDVAAVSADLQSATTTLRGEMALIEHRLLTRLGSLVVVVAGLLFAALRYFPPAH
jgi:hypothetical protein